MEAFHCNYKGKDKENKCPLCEEEQDSKEHAYECKTIKNILKIKEMTPEDIESEQIKDVIKVDVLVSSIREAPRFSDLSHDEVADLFISSQKVSNVVKDVYNATSLTLAVQDGPDAGQTVPHVHVHILPRLKGDFANNDDIYSELEKHDKEENRKPRSLEDMAIEASKLRTFFHDKKT
eukprot:gene2381-18024_t